MPARAQRSLRLLAALLSLAALSLPFATCGGGGAGSGSPSDGSYRPADGPARSFLLLTLDTVSPDHLEPYGAADAETPALAALARDGAVLERAYAATPVTLPSHTSMLTGLDPPGHGVRNNGIHYLPEDVPTLAEHLKDAGFATAAFVSAAVLEARYGLDRGFDHYDDDLSAGRPRTRLALAERPAEATVDAALAWLEARHRAPGEADGPGDTNGPEGPGGAGDQPFFLWVHLFDPHAAYEPPSPWAERFAHRPYDGEIAYMDSQIARLLEHPDLASPTTLVMAVGDHGESLGVHGEATHAMLAYDATLWVPWILRGPGVEPGLRSEVEVGHVDLLPTALELLGRELPGEQLRELPGRSLAPLLAGEAADDPAPRAVYTETDLYAETLVPFYTYGWAPLHTLRRDGWKYIRAPSPELYHVAEDPGEEENLLEREPERAARLAGRLEERLGEAGEAPPGTTPATGPGEGALRHPDREARERLRSLGYLAAGAPSGAPPSEPPGPRRDPKTMMAVHRAVERAQHHLYRRDFQRAVRELRPVLAEDPGNRVALADLARALGELGRTAEALEAARRALEVAPGDPELLLLLAALESARGRTGRSLEVLDAALAADPRSPDVRVEKARLLLEMAAAKGPPGGSRYARSEALALLRQVLEEDPDHPHALVLEAETALGREGEPDLQHPDPEHPDPQHLARMVERLARITEREPFLAQGWRTLGRLLERTGEPERAMEVYRQGLVHLRRDAGLHALLGSLLAEQGAAEEAREHLERALELGGEGPEAGRAEHRAQLHGALSLAALNGGDWRRAEAEARRALELTPGRAAAWSHLAVALEEQGRTGEALAAYGEARRVDPEYWQAAFNRGLLLRKLGREGEAVEAFQEVLARQPDHAKSHYELGVLHGAAGRAGLARRHLLAALEAEPEHPRGGQVRRLLAALEAEAEGGGSGG